MSPPRLRPSASRARAGPPFWGASGVLVRPDARGVEEEPLEVGVLDGLEERGPDAALAPAVEPLEDGVPAAELGRERAPRGAGAGDPHDGVEEAPVVVAGAASGAVPSRDEGGEAGVVGVGEGVGRHGSGRSATEVSANDRRHSNVNAP